jgi:hypothetical protein
MDYGHEDETPRKFRLQTRICVEKRVRVGAGFQ